MKKLFIFLIVLVVSLFTSRAAVGITTMSDNINWICLTNSAHLESVTFFSTNSGMVFLTDHSTNSYDLRYTNGAYTNITIYITNLVNNYVTSTGTTNYFTNTVLWTAKSAMPAATNYYQPFAIFYVEANVPITINLDKDLMRGLVTRPETITGTIIYNYTYNK